MANTTPTNTSSEAVIFFWICAVIFALAGAYLLYVANKERGNKARLRYQPFVNGIILVGAGVFWAIVAIVVSL